MDPQATPNLLREKRWEQGLTQAEAAQAAHMSESQLSRLERGQRCPTIQTLARLAPVLGLGPADILELMRAFEDYGDGRRSA